MTPERALADWERRHGGREFQLGDPAESEQFATALGELIRQMNQGGGRACIRPLIERGTVVALFVRIS